MARLDLLNDLLTAQHKAAPAPVSALPFRTFAARTAPTPGYTVPVLPRGDKTLRDYQVAAVETALTFKHVALGHQPGMGKTPIMHAIIAAVSAQGPTVAVVPPSLRVDPWQTLVAEWGWPIRIHVVEGRKAAPLPAGYDLYLVGDSVLAARLVDLQRLAPVCVMGDEAHRYKSPEAARARAWRHLAEGTKEVKSDDGKVSVVPTGIPAPEYVVISTGTIAVNRTNEVFMPIRSLGTAVMRQIAGGTWYTDFRNRWCITETVWTGKKNIEKVTGCVDPEGLNEALRSSCYVRVERAEVGGWPNKGLITRNLSLNGSLKTYRRMADDFLAFVRDTKGRKAAGRAAKAEAVTRLMALWQEAGKAKATAAVEYVTNLLDQGEPVVVFGWHRDVVTNLRDSLGADYRVVTIMGGETSQAKADAVAAFQAGKADVIVANITAGGVGITLDRAAHLVFVQLPWSPGDFVQASDRIYRLTQTRDCLIHVLNAADTVDATMWNVLVEKAAVVDVINSGERGITLPGDETVIDGVLAALGWED